MRFQLTHVLALLAHLPALLPNARTHLPRLKEFYEQTLGPRLDPHVPTSGSQTMGTSAATNGLLRKMAVKARGRWWVAMLGVTMSEAGRVRRSGRGRRRGIARGEYWQFG
jgi:hypothetical protein